MNGYLMQQELTDATTAIMAQRYVEHRSPSSRLPPFQSHQA